MFDFKIETRFLFEPTISKLNVNLIIKHAYQNEDYISKSQLDSKIELQFWLQSGTSVSKSIDKPLIDKPSAGKCKSTPYIKVEFQS